MNTSREDRLDDPRPDADHEERTAWKLASSVATDGLWYWDVRRRIVRLSQQADELLGNESHELSRTPEEMLQFVDGGDLPAFREAMRTLISGERLRVDLELRALTARGERRWVHLRARARHGADGQTRTIAGAISDIDARKRTEDQLRHESRHDPLTGLPNRAALMDALTARIARASVNPHVRFAVLYMDLDHFKLVNDTLGHACGDDVLASAATRLAECIGPDDLLARIAGDEFVAVLDTVANDAEARYVADRLHAAMRDPLVVGSRRIFSTLSIGVRVSGTTRCKPSDVIRDADVAMYQAKRCGGGRTVAFDQSMQASMARRFTMECELQRALHENELRVAYHPIFDVIDHHLCGFEAVVRWDHPTRGHLSAEAFVADANETGLIVPIGRWVMREACGHIAELASAYPNAAKLSVGVNVCDRELVDPEFAENVEAILHDTGVGPSQLCLEMSEGAVAPRIDQVAPALQRLRTLGVQVRIDGFGAGQTSLGTLRRLPLSAVKLDRCMVKDVARCEEARALVATILMYAERLGLDVIADGVDTREQADALAAIGDFRYVQGELAKHLAS